MGWMAAIVQGSQLSGSSAVAALKNCGTLPQLLSTIDRSMSTDARVAELEKLIK